MTTAPRANLFPGNVSNRNNVSPNITVQEIAQPVDEELELLDAEDAYDRQISIEVAAYYLGMKRRQHGQPGDALSDWLQAEKTAEEDLAKRNH